MSTADSISIFAEGTFEDQIKELVNYLAQGRSDEEKAAFIQPFEDALTVKEGEKSLEEDAERRRNVLKLVLEQITGLGEGSEKETEGFFNLFFSHFLTLFPIDAPETREQLLKLVQIISQSNGLAATQYRILSNLFNSLPRRSGLRLPVNEALIRAAAAHDELEQLALSLPEIEQWLSEWEVSQEDKSAYLKTLVDTFAYDPVVSYQYQLAYVRSLPSSSEAAADLVATALRLPSVFDFDALFRLDAVVAAKDNDIYPLLQIFLNDGISEYKAWVAGHADVLAKYNLDQTQLERKIRLLSLTTLAFQNIGRDLPYSIIADVLQVPSSEVERWVIDVLRAQLVVGKLSQTSQTFHIVRASARAFEREQWEALEKRLVAWKAGLASVREVVASTQKKNNQEIAAATGTTNGVEPAAAQPQSTAA
ncbi:PCI-domain-containing protein [Phanerochaete sordida]|uniref:Eukaryotic translation initiation factor 3 subunit M n=1 Tax=Phanerochaete sordida TaxID=48140 RepID=A0A9P3L819_9APHY|nr:PCI-domain-containing protein [Phanerochaete sordida]